MYKHILLATDGSALSLKAARTAGKLAAKLRAKVSAIYVIEPYMPPMAAEGAVLYAAYSPEEYERGMRKVADRAIARAASAAGMACASVVRIQTDPWKAIIDTARKGKCDLIVMSSHGRRGIAGLLLGSETQKVLTHSKVPVLVCR